MEALSQAIVSIDSDHFVNFKKLAVLVAHGHVYEF